MAKFLLLVNPIEYITSPSGRTEVPVSSYLPAFKSCAGGAEVFIVTKPVTTLAEVSIYCQKRGITGVFTNQDSVLKKLAKSESPKISEYEGSYFNEAGLEWVIISPLAQLVSVPEGRFLTTRYVSKLTRPEDWPVVPSFSWTLLNPSNIESFYENLQTCIAIAIDIETVRDPLAIRCISYTGIRIADDGITLFTGVLPLDSEWALAWIRKINRLQIGKIFQRGRYDIAYLQRYNAVPDCYYWDTANMFHCWYSELDKDLATLSAFFVRKARYWKDLANTNDLMEYYKYNALDTYNTALVFLAWIEQAPDWAKTNYLAEFPLQFACHLSEMIGIKRDVNERNKLSIEIQSEIDSDTAKLQRLIGEPNFNPNSSQQCKKLLQVLGCGNVASADEKHLQKFSFQHPLNSFILQRIISIREKRKLSSTYLCEGREFPGTTRFLYSLNPDNTDTGRLASKDHPFWCGMNIQNQPSEDRRTKSTFIADEGFRFFEIDLKQAETRDTGYIAGDEKLIAAVTGDRDFHSINAAAFFGKQYDDIYDSKLGKTKDKKLRDLSKRTNHGATYVMGAGVMLDTMGMEKVTEARKLLNLPKTMELKKVCEYLLGRFHSTYTGLQGNLYPYVKATVKNTKMLTGATGWTRYCFMDPIASKHAFNAYVAHNAQSLNAQKLNIAYMRVFYQIALHSQHKYNFKLCAQIHDSILCQIRIGHEYLAEMVAKLMEVTIDIIGCDGKKRTYFVPADIKGGKDGKGAYRWSDTE